MSMDVQVQENKRQQQDWEAEQAARTLIQAEEIRQNKSLMRRAQKHLDRQTKAALAARERSGGADLGTALMNA